MTSSAGHEFLLQHEPTTDASSNFARYVVAETAAFFSLPILNFDEIPNRFGLPDATTKLILRDPSGTPRAAVICSSPQAPDGVRRAALFARGFKQMLSGPYAAAILDPLLEGRFEGRSYVVLPYCTPTPKSRWARWWHRRGLTGPVLEWLRAVATDTVRTPTEGQVKRHFVAPLERMAAERGLSDGSRRRAEAALRDLAAGQWKPVHVAMHNDLWLENILIDDQGVTGRSDQPRFRRFVIIDWGGAALEGYPIYDLLRTSSSLGLSRARLAAELRFREEVFGCNRAGLYHHLAAALAHLGVNRNHFPMERYAAVVDECFGHMESTLGS